MTERSHAVFLALPLLLSLGCWGGHSFENRYYPNSSLKDRKVRTGDVEFFTVEVAPGKELVLIYDHLEEPIQVFAWATDQETYETLHISVPSDAMGKRLSIDGKTVKARYDYRPPVWTDLYRNLVISGTVLVFGMKKGRLSARLDVTLRPSRGEERKIQGTYTFEKGEGEPVWVGRGDDP